MFIFFHKNKFSSNQKGQLVPIFIVVLVVLVIMSMVTVNLSKVSLFKTASSNAVDSGALAAGSVMANVFNGIAQANSQFETIYWEFYASASVAFVLAYVDLIKGETAATAAEAAATSAMPCVVPPCPGPCEASGLAATADTQATLAAASLQKVVMTAWGILIAVTAFSIAQYYYYLSLRRSAKQGWESAVEMGHRFVFMNSDIGSKMKSGDAPAEETRPEYQNNFRNKFSDFLDDKLGHGLSYQYLWKDGQDRLHYVHSTIDVDPFDTFDLKVAIMPLPVELALLYKVITMAEAASISLTTASIAYDAAILLLDAACTCQACCNNPFTAAVCCPCWEINCAEAQIALEVGLEANIIALAEMKPIYTYLALTWAGLLPGFTFRDNGSLAALLFTICWIDDIVHNRKVRVDSWQHHEGASLGLWNTEYPDVHSFSIVNFEGQGKIHPPKLRFDASVVAVDKIGTADTSADPAKDCPYVLGRIPALEQQIDDWLASADAYEESASAMEKQAEQLRISGLLQEADDLLGPASKEGTVANVRQKALDARESADLVQEEIDNLKSAYAHCF